MTAAAKYSKLTKSELLILVDQIEAELTDARSHTLDGKWEAFVKEVKLLAEDIQKAVVFVYNTGVSVRQQLSAVRVLKD
jgi:hypothetical protein